MLRAALIALISILLAALAGCAQGPEEDADAAADVELPDWLDSVSPIPGAEAAATDLIEVHHNATEEDTGVRMIIDGVDVTASAIPRDEPEARDPIGINDENTFEGEGRLSYDPNTDIAPVSIDPGEHTVLLEHVRLPEPGAQLEVLDTFEWTFTVL